METHKAVLMLADISGYTKFLRLHRTSIYHAEMVISELLETVLHKTQPPLKLVEIEGDAVFLFAPLDGDANAAKQIMQQAQSFFHDFNRRAHELTLCKACVCSACSQTERLKLKVIIHYGDIVMRRVAGFEHPAGEDVVAVHQLLKNSVSSNEYILMTDRFVELCGDVDLENCETTTEKVAGLGKISVKVHYPAGYDKANTGKIAMGERLKHFLKMEGYSMMRFLGLKKAPFEFKTLTDQ